ncbi:MAG TPA: hypothetical protein PKD20_02180 [Candidatus Saccharibacteria bacterium]|jgi:hypothetical protein|nr:hypothetical protein [Candidatus Saccharibacteria bacterium]HMT55662.1 hypothetical protein [Candidatus Saccharibacteria bacterium]
MKRLRNLLVALLMLGFVLTSPLHTQAQTQGSNGLSITPTRFEFTIERGKSDLASIQIKNVTDQPILAKAFINDFEADGNTGNPKLIIDDSRERSSSSIKDFVLGLEDVEVPGGETKVVNLPIQIPENAAPSAYYGAIRFQSAKPNSDEITSPQVALNASVAALVLIEVPGDITEKVEISSIGAYLDDKKGTIFTKKPMKVGIEVNNLGNGFSKPFGKVSVSGPWGKGEVLSYELNNTDPRGNVLPNSKRLFLNDLSGVSLPGRYTITANISHGRGGQVLTATTSFWFIPSWLIIVLAVLLLALVIAAVYVYRKYVTKGLRRK